MFPHLSGFRVVNLGILQEAASKELLGMLDKCEGTKAIVWDDSLAGPYGLVAKYTVLKERNVTKMLALRPGGNLPDLNVKHIIFIVRPNVKSMDYIAENVHNEVKRQSALERGSGQQKLQQKEFHLYFVPRISQLCIQQLKNSGVFGSFVNVDQFKCEIFPVDYDLLSLELNDTFRELYIEGDPTCLYMSASALISLQKVYGRIPKIYGKGECALKVWELAQAMMKEEPINNHQQHFHHQSFGSGGSGGGGSSGEKGSIDQLILIDRTIDLMSVLATQLTYEGLIDENFSINQTTVQFEPDRFTNPNEGAGGFSGLSTSSAGGSSSQTTNDKKLIILNSDEDLYKELRDKNFNAVGQILSRHANSISNQLNGRYGDKSVQDIKKFVERLPEVLSSKQSLATHTTIAEMIKEITSSDEFLDELNCEQEFLICSDIDKPSPFIEDLIAKEAPLRTVIRLICMQCIAGSGLKQKILDFYKRDLVQVYGIKVLLTISNLERAGLLKVQSGSRTYAVIRKTFNLTVDDAIEVAPKDISYVHTFYAPLTIRIVEQSLKMLGWQALQDVLGLLPGPVFEDYQMGNGISTGTGSGGSIIGGIAGLLGTSTTGSSIGGRRSSIGSEISQSDQPRVILVFFLGGCTFAEISALRFLAQDETNNVEFIIATTKLINKNTFLNGFIQN